MDLLEYQSKELFQQMGIPVLPSQRIEHAKDLKGLKIAYPIVLKSQVYTGGRGKAGGVRFAANTIDAVAAAQAIFRLPIMGQYPQVLLAETKYSPDRELYLAVVLDRSSRRPLLLGSQEGGIDVESVVGHMQHVLVDQEFSPFYARRLALQMGLQGKLIQAVSDILEKMYHLFVENDLDLVEINPLAVNPAGEVMALDGRVIVNDEALDRHPQLLALQVKTSLELNRRTPADLPAGMKMLEFEGSIGILCNGGALSMTTVDLVHRAGGKPGACLNVGGEFSHAIPPTQLAGRVQRGLDLLAQDRGIRVVLVNVLSGVADCAQVASAIAAHLRRRIVGARPTVVVRLAGTNLDKSQDILQPYNVPVIAELDEAIAQTVSLSQSRVA